MLFAIIGVLPFAFAIAVRTQAARVWAARELSAVLQAQFGIRASFDAAIRPWPLTLTATGLRVESSDGGRPALEVDQLSVRPKIFALIQGRIDAGDIEIDRPRVHLELVDGKLVNLEVRAPEGGAKRSEHAPFQSIAINDASAEVTIDGVLVRATGVDLDVSAEEGAYELALHAGAFSAERGYVLSFAGPEAPEPVEARDEDVICSADARIRVAGGSVLVRRLRVKGSADFDPATGTAPSCELAHDDARRVELELRNARLELDEAGPASFNGAVRARGPMRLLNRFVAMMPWQGWVEAEAEAHWKRGKSLPDVRGTVQARGIKMGKYALASSLSVTARLEDGVVHAPSVLVGWSDGKVHLTDVEARPLEAGVPIKAGLLTIDHLQMPGMMRDLGVTEHTVVKMDYRDGTFTSLSGTIFPLHLESDMVVHVGDFNVLDGAWHDPSAQRVLGVKQSTVRARFVVTDRAVEFRNANVEFGKSHLNVYCSLGFDNQFRLSVTRGSRVELAEIGPLLDMPWSGAADISTEITGVFEDPTITSELSVNRFEFAGFSFGDVQSARSKFKPLVLEFTDIKGRKGSSHFKLPTMRIKFDGPAPVILDTEVESSDFDIRDFLATLRLERDPRLARIHGAARVRSTVHLASGGPEDRCGGGYLAVRAQANFHRVELFGEKYDKGEVDLEYRSNDARAKDLGIELDIRSAVLRKGQGTIVGSGTVRNGGVVRAHVVASDVPLSSLQALGSVGSQVDARLAATAEVRGTLDRLEADVDARMSPMRVGTAVLPASRLAIRLVPIDRPVKLLGRTRCGQPITSGFDPVEYARDLPQGIFHATGQLFGGQLAFQDLRITRQSNMEAEGQLVAERLDLLPFMRLKASPEGVSTATHAWLSGVLDLKRLELDTPANADVALTVTQLEVGNVQGAVKLRPGTPAITLADAEFNVPKVLFDFSSAQGLKGTFVASGKVRNVAAQPELDFKASLLPLDLSALPGLLTRVERASGTAQASVGITGPVSSPRYSGEFTVRNGSLLLAGLPLPIEGLNVDVRLNEREIKLERASARFGGGTVNAVGTLPVKGFDFGTAVASLTARGVSLPLIEGVNMVVDADLSTAWSARLGEEEKSMPRVVGDVTLVSFDYSRPIAINADIGSLAQRGKRTRFESYDPEADFVSFEIRLRAFNPLRLRNNMADLQLLSDAGTLTLTGTNQRVGLRGDLRVKPGGRLKLRTSEFEVRQGSVRFDDASRIAPVVDLTAVTEYRRYSQAHAATPGAGVAAGAAAGGSGAGVGRTGGQWRIQMHAHGDADNLKLDLTSEPGLSQEDIVLLLTLGVTRAELDQMQASNLGETAALEALSTLTGADSAVKGAIPVIDDFRLGSAYSSRTGRTEPTVTMGKRVTDRVRATVTSGLSENREVRSNVEWQLTPRSSVLGSYDNVNNVSSSALGNLGADMRFRIEFE